MSEEQIKIWKKVEAKGLEKLGNIEKALLAKEGFEEAHKDYCDFVDRLAETTGLTTGELDRHFTTLLEESEGQIRKKAYSKNPMKSGRRGSRTGQHAADNVPEKGTTQSGNYGEVIGWEKSDTSPFFYMKFHEWGTTMHKPKKFMLEAARPTYRALKSIAEEEYEKVLKEKLGG